MNEDIQFLKDLQQDYGMVKLNDKIYVIPTNDKPVKIVYENNGCDICNKFQNNSRETKTNQFELTVCKCNHCGREFFV